MSELAGVPLELDRLSYFLSAYTLDWDVTQRAGGYMGLFPPPRDLEAFPQLNRVKPQTEF